MKRLAGIESVKHTVAGRRCGFGLAWSEENFLPDVIFLRTLSFFQRKVFIHFKKRVAHTQKNVEVGANM